MRSVGNAITYFSTRKACCIYMSVGINIMIWEGYNWILNPISLGLSAKLFHSCGMIEISRLSNSANIYTRKTIFGTQISHYGHELSQLLISPKLWLFLTGKLPCFRNLPHSGYFLYQKSNPIFENIYKWTSKVILSLFIESVRLCLFVVLVTNFVFSEHSFNKFSNP